LNLDLESNWEKKDFEDAVLSAKEYIRKGDIFQIVISQRFQTQVNNDPFNLYRSLRMVNPSPYMSFFDFGSWYLIGSSPEVMVKAEKNKNNQIVASLRPIAGTRPRGKDPQQDLQLEKDLLNDPKEIAEHVMLIDLGRNDLGRVCEVGTVEVKDLMVIEKYSHVMHIVSEVEGVLKNNTDVWDLLKACFPAGTVTGAPKIRAMQLINSFEKDARGPYAGVYGSIDINGALNTAITIRTMIVKPSKDGKYNVAVQAGAGIVADSSPENEYQETINIICEEKKDICFKRRLIRDKLERNRNTSEVNRKFTRSWNLFYKNIRRYIDINRKISLNPVDKISYDNLVDYLQNISKK